MRRTIKISGSYNLGQSPGPPPPPRVSRGSTGSTNKCLLTDGLFPPRQFWTKTQTFTFFAIVSVARVFWAHLNSGLKHVVPTQFSDLVTLGFLFCRLQAGNWKMGHRKPGLLHLSHFVIAALVSFCFVCQLCFNPHYDGQALLSGRTQLFLLPKKTHGDCFFLPRVINPMNSTGNKLLSKFFFNSSHVDQKSAWN